MVAQLRSRPLPSLSSWAGRHWAALGDCMASTSDDCVSSSPLELVHINDGLGEPHRPRSRQQGGDGLALVSLLAGRPRQRPQSCWGVCGVCGVLSAGSAGLSVSSTTHPYPRTVQSHSPIAQTLTAVPVSTVQHVVQVHQAGSRSCRPPAPRRRRRKAAVSLVLFLFLVPAACRHPFIFICLFFSCSSFRICC